MNDISQYELLRDKFKTGDVIEYRSKGFVGEAIRMKTGFGVNHSEMVVVMQSPYTGVKRVYTHGALGNGLIPEYLSVTLTNYDGIAFWYPIKDEYVKDIPQIETNAFTYLGVKYDYEGLAEQLLGHTRIQTGHLFCSESVQVICYGCNDTIKNGGIALWPGELTAKGGVWQTPGYQLMEDKA